MVEKAMNEMKKGKVVLIGLGNVGAAILNSLLRLGAASELVVINRNDRKAKGAVLDASHTLPFNNCPNVEVRTGDFQDCSDAQIIIVAAGPSIKPGERDRSLVLKQNIEVLFDTMEKITCYTKKSCIILVSNPNDLLVYMAQRYFDYPSDKIMGTGTLVDTARLNKMLADLCDVDPKNVNGFVLGEHGDTSFIPWNTVNVGCVAMADLEKEYGLERAVDQAALQQEVQKMGFQILDLRGYTSWGVALSACRIAESIIKNEKSILPVSIVIDGPYGIHGIAMSLPCVLSSQGISRVLELPLDEQGQKDLERCVTHLAKMQKNAEEEAERILASC